MPLEKSWQENRVALTPDGVAMLVNNGHNVLIESNAGAAAKFTDNEYSEAGAQIIYNSQQLYSDAKVIMKVGPPTLDEINNLMQPGTFVLSAMHVAQSSAEYIKALNKKHICASAFEFLEDEEGGMPVMRAMSEISGCTVMSIAASYLWNTSNGRGVIVGGITGVPPTKVVIIGAGTVAECAARVALGMGAEVRIFDSHLYKLRRIRQELGHNIYTTTLNQSTLAEALREADVAIGAVRAEEGRSPCVVTEKMVSDMNPGSIIIDVSIDQGGCFETSEVTTHRDPVYKKYGVLHYCVPNIASQVARTATIALSNIFAPLLLKASDLGGLEDMIFSREWFMHSIYTYKGHLTHAGLARRFAMKHYELSLLRMGTF